MTSPLIHLQQIKNRDELVETWGIVKELSYKFPDDTHWSEVVEAFKARAKELEQNG